MSIKMIAAVGKNNEIGYKNDLLFRIPEDMKHFKELTTGTVEGGHFCVMGKRTFQSLPKPLAGRVNVVLTRDSNFPHPPEVFVMNSVEQIINHYQSGNQTKDIWICGGSEVYKLFLPYADEVHLTHIDKEAKKADTYFPKDILKEYFNVDKYSEWHFSEEEDCSYCFVTYLHK
ncbi:dihydrofolate reductase [Bacillus sp. FJAT-22090]|uniref:dihydrofolate reductase n=1 Tax=Bacillus sp. FJAT-22090 TaxID=1581038 RepID=UPI0011A19289|nr:dihydrofolate reductase [Bacillus sp. FJAT-22090]